MTISRDADYPDKVRRKRGPADSDYLAYLTTGYLDSAAKKGEPGAAEQDGPGFVEPDEPGAVEPDELGAGEQVDPEYIIFLNSLRKINNVWHVEADERNRLVQGYILEDVTVGDDAELSIPVFSYFDQCRKRKTENGTDSDSAYAADPNLSENEKHDATENISHSRKGEHIENCNPMPPKDFQLAKRVKSEVVNADPHLIFYLESKVIGTDGRMNVDASFRRGNLKSPGHIGRSPEHIGSSKPTSPTHNESSKRSYIRSSEIKSPVPIPSSKRGSLAQTRISKIIPPENIGGSTLKPPAYRSPEYSGSSKMKSPVHNGSFKPETPRHIQGSKPEPPVQIRRPKPEPHVHGFQSEPIQTSSVNEDNVSLGCQSAGNSKFATYVRDRKSDVDEDEDLVCLGSPSAKTSSSFEENLLTVLSKPFDWQELQMLDAKAKSSKKVERLVDLRNGREKLVATDKDGKAFIDHYPDLRRKLNKSDDNLTRLNLLRGFFFWIQHLTQDGAFQPWQGKK